MNQYFIKKYIDKLTIDDILRFAESQGAKLSHQECDYLLQVTRTHYQELLYGNPEPIFEQAKQHLSQQNYKIAQELYAFYKQKYQSFL